MKDIKLVIFDLDGLLMDTEKLGLEGWENAFNQIGVKISREALMNRIGRNQADVKKTIIEAAEDDFDYEAAREIMRKYIIDYANENGMPLKKGVIELLSYLEKVNIRKCVATSRGISSAEKYLKMANIYEQFDYIVTGDMVEKGKPEPDIFIYASEIFDVKPSECLVLEDSINGVMAGVRAEMKTIMIPDMIPSTKEIEEVIYSKCDSLLDVIELFKNSL